MKRIAIYARKSVEVKDSVSIETQVNMCKNYFADEQCEFEIFKDDGYSGSSTNRPAFKLLHKKIELEMFDTLICYKLDRISRKVLDMADFFELLENKNVAFICVKDKYDTSTPMGRAMIYFASVFAQLERETIAERVKDSMFQLAKKGCWAGGSAPSGYKLIRRNGKSYIELDNKDFILDCFNSYLQLNSLYALHKKLKPIYGIPGSREALDGILRSPVYVQSTPEIHTFLKKHGWDVVGEPTGCGYLLYGVDPGYPTAIVSTHEAVVTPTLWFKVQEKLTARRESFYNRQSKTHWLSGILKCPFCGSMYLLSTCRKITYYACRNRIDRFKKLDKKCENNKYTPTLLLEGAVEIYLNNIRDKKEFEERYNVLDEKKESVNIKQLKNTMDKNTKMIDNLVSKISLLSDEAGEFLLKRIEELTKENKRINEELDKEKLNALELQSKKFDKEYIYENICKFKDATNNEDKRICAQNIFEYIEYNPISKEIRYKFL